MYEHKSMHKIGPFRKERMVKYWLGLYLHHQFFVYMIAFFIFPRPRDGKLLFPVLFQAFGLEYSILFLVDLQDMCNC